MSAKKAFKNPLRILDKLGIHALMHNHFINAKCTRRDDQNIKQAPQCSIKKLQWVQILGFYKDNTVSHYYYYYFFFFSWCNYYLTSLWKENGSLYEPRTLLKHETKHTINFICQVLQCIWLCLQIFKCAIMNIERTWNPSLNNNDSNN